jgi:PAS domain S-box-containing protein
MTESALIGDEHGLRHNAAVTGAYPATAPVWRSPPDPAQVAQARRFVRDVLGETHATSIDAAQLLVTELVTNAMLHAGAEVEVRLWATSDRVHVRVSDTARDRGLFPRQLDCDASTGRGLQLVHALAAAHGVELTDFGKTVWFELWPGIQAQPNPTSTWLLSEIEDSFVGKPVLLSDVPIGLFRAAQRHRDSLLRECKLLVLSGRHLPGVPVHDLGAAEAANGLIARAVLGEIEAAMQADPSLTHVTVQVSLPEACVDSVRVLGSTLEKANVAARQATFLTRPALPEIRAFRNWLLEQIITQLSDGPITSWGARASHALPGGSVSARVNPVDRSGPVIVAGDDNVILGVGDAIEALLGWPPSDLIGRRIVAIIPPRLHLQHVAGFTNFLLTGSSRIIGSPVVVAALHRDGHEVPVQLLLGVEQSQDGRPLFVATLDPASGDGALS